MFYNRVKGRKYNNIKTEYNGIKFDSKAELNRYKELLLLQRAGEMTGLETQVKFVLQNKFKHDDINYRAITYTADFVYVEHGSNIIIVEDLKSKATADDKYYKMKKKMVIKHLMELEKETGVQYRFREVIK